MYDTDFCVPFQEVYEDMTPEDARSRYSMVIDGDVLDSKRVKYLTKDSLLAKEYSTQITGLNNWIDSYKGQIDGLKHELAKAHYQLEQLKYGADPVQLDRAMAGSPRPFLGNVRGRDLVAELRQRVRRRLTGLLRRGGHD